MNAVLTLYHSTVGKKIAMGVTGLMMAGWVTMHMLGNLQVFAGAEVLDAYGHKIQSMGPILWAMRAVMLSALVVHVWSAISLSRGAMAARAVGYQGGKASFAATLASKTMRVGGIVLVIYLMFHLLDLTIGAVNPDFRHGEVFHNLTGSLKNPAVAALYAVASLSIGAHVYHGIASALQTLGTNHARWNKTRFGVSAAVGVAVMLGNLSIVLAIALGLVG